MPHDYDDYPARRAYRWLEGLNDRLNDRSPDEAETSGTVIAWTIGILLGASVLFALFAR